MDTNFYFKSVVSRDINTLRKLLKEGIDVNITEPEGAYKETALHIACRTGNHEIVKILVNEYNANVNIINSEEETPLMLSWTYDTIELLLQKGANIKAEDIYGNNTFGVACKEGVNVNIIKLLLKYIDTYDLSYYENSLTTPLMHSCIEGNLEVVKFLVETGFNIDTKNYQEWTALMFAADYNRRDKNLRIMEFLIMEGADTEHRNCDGQTVLDLTKNKDNKIQIKKLIDSLKTVNLKPAKQ
jgi:ankyrin repeat protein